MLFKQLFRPYLTTARLRKRQFYIIQRSRENGRRKTVNVASADSFEEILDTLHKLEAERPDVILRISHQPRQNWE